MSFFNYLIKTLILSLIITAITVALFYIFPELYFFNFPSILLFVLIISLASNYFILKHFNNPKVFVRKYLAAFGIKLLISLGFLIILFITDKDNVLKSGISFILVYLIFLVFDTIQLLKIKSSK